MAEEAVMFPTVTMSAYQDQLNAGFSKACEVLLFKIHPRDLLKALSGNVWLYAGLYKYINFTFSPP